MLADGPTSFCVLLTFCDQLCVDKNLNHGLDSSFFSAKDGIYYAIVQWIDDEISIRRCVRLHKLIYSSLREWISSWIRSASDTPRTIQTSLRRNDSQVLGSDTLKQGGRPGEYDARIQLRRSFNSRRGKNTFPSHRFRTEQRRRDKRNKTTTRNSNKIYRFASQSKFSIFVVCVLRVSDGWSLLSKCSNIMAVGAATAIWTWAITSFDRETDGCVDVDLSTHKPLVDCR